MAGQDEDWAEIRRLRTAEGMAIKAIVRKTGISRNAVDELVAASQRPAVRAGSSLARGTRISAVDWLERIIGWALGAAVVWSIGREFRKRRELARRRPFHRYLLVGGGFLGLFAALTWFLAIAAGTSGSPADHNDAVMLAWIGVALAVAGAGLLILWWRLAGQRS